MYPKDTEKWKQFTTACAERSGVTKLFCIPKILKNESNSQPDIKPTLWSSGCFVSQRYWKMKAIHNCVITVSKLVNVVLYPKDTEKWKQFTTWPSRVTISPVLFCIPKILKNESNSQPPKTAELHNLCCFVSQRYWKMKAIHNSKPRRKLFY